MPDLFTLLEGIKKRLRPLPSQEKKINAFVASLTKRLLPLSVDVFLGGSYAKGTAIRNSFDVDIFVRFKPHEKDIAKQLGNALASYRPLAVQGSRTYYQIHHGGFVYEIVPVYAIEHPSQAQNTMDMSVFHVQWVRNALAKNPSLADEIRLTKQFCKAQRCYGAESYILGFSGHVVDILTIHAGGFLPLLKNAVQWKPKQVIDPSHAYASPTHALKALNQAKIQSPLIVIDPLLPSRNAAAALSKEQYDVFVHAAKKFLNKPSKSFFIIKPFNLSQAIKKKGMLVLGLTLYAARKDIVGTRVVKCLTWIKSLLEKNGFPIFHASWDWNQKTKAWIIIKTKERIAQQYLLQGPPISQELNSKAFCAKHQQCYQHKGRWIAKEIRQFPTLSAFAKNVILQDSYVRSLVQSLRLLAPLSPRILSSSTKKSKKSKR
ncbi:MAG: nucleotidyltransferase domain-containing protein [Candidatus Woesearchaeota archaeon]